MTETIPYFEDPRSKPLPNLPSVERDTINAILYNRGTKEALCLDWPKFDWHTFIIGGIEGNEDPVKAAEREIREETGYKNIKLVADLGKTRAGYYAAHKKENRISTASCFLFELVNDEKEEVLESEVANHTFVWIPKENVAKFIDLTSQSYIWEQALKVLD